jgi:hypothetical protein
VTDSFDPKAPKSSRKKPKREPATIDLKATVVHDAPPPEDKRPQETSSDVPSWEAPSQEGSLERTVERPAPMAEDAAAQETATLDSGIGVDSIEGTAPAQEAPVDTASAAGISGQTVPVDETVMREEPPQDTLGSAHDTVIGDRDTLAGASPPPDMTPPDVPPPRAQPAPRSHAGAMIGSGLLGGLIGAGLLYGLQHWQGAPSGNDQRLVQLEQRVGALAQQRATPGQPASANGPLESRLAAVETALGSVDQRVQAAQGAAEQATARAQEALNRPAPEAPPQNETVLAQLSERVARTDEQIQANAQQIQQAQAGLQQVQQAQGSLQQMQGALQQVQTDLQQARADMQQAGAQARQAAEGRTAEVDRRLSEQDRRATEQEQRLADLSRKVTQTAEATTQPAIRVILAERLGSALRNGSPYTEVLSALRNVETDPGRLQALEPFAQQGAPTAAELAQDFQPLGEALLRSERPTDATWTDRLLRMADKVVTVKPVEAPETAGVTSVVGQIEQALARGDVAAAVSAWEALPEPSRRLSEAWGRQAKARAQADAAAQTIVSDAVAALNTRTTQ